MELAVEPATSGVRFTQPSRRDSAVLSPAFAATPIRPLTNN